MERLPNYDSWKLQDSNGEEKVIGCCEHCGEEIFKGQDVFKTDDGLFCDKEEAIEYLLEGVNGKEEVAE